MALAFKPVKVNLVGGSSIYVMSHQIVEITGSNGDCEVLVNDNGNGLTSYASTDDITTGGTGLIALAEDIFTLSTADGDRYLNALNVKGILPKVDIAASALITFDSGAGTITDLTYNSVSLFDTGTPVSGASLLALATNLADAINSYTSTPNYTAIAKGETVTIYADPSQGAALNGEAGTVTVTSTLVVTAADLDGGVDASIVKYDNGFGYSKLIDSDESVATVYTNISAL